MGRWLSFWHFGLSQSTYHGWSIQHDVWDDVHHDGAQNALNAGATVYLGPGPFGPGRWTVQWLRGSWDISKFLSTIFNNLQSTSIVYYVRSWSLEAAVQRLASGSSKSLTLIGLKGSTPLISSEAILLVQKFQPPLFAKRRNSIGLRIATSPFQRSETISLAQKIQPRYLWAMELSHWPKKSNLSIFRADVSIHQMKNE